VEQPAARANDRRTGDPSRSRGKLLWKTVVRVQLRRCSAVDSAPWDKTDAVAASAMAGLLAVVVASRPDSGAGASAVRGNTGGGFGR